MTQGRTPSDDKPKRGAWRRPLTPLAEDAESLLSTAAKARGFSHPQILWRWPAFAGETLGYLTVPVSLSAEGVLTVAADPSVAIFLQHQTAQLVQRVNLTLGSPVVSRLKVVQSRFSRPSGVRPRPKLDPSQTAKLAKQLEPVVDEGLKEALTRLAAGVLDRRAARPGGVR